MRRSAAIVLALTVILAGSAAAWQPEGWVYFQWPWAFDGATADWHWFSSEPENEQWVHGFPPAGGWSRMGESRLVEPGWTFHAHPFIYSQNEDAWYFVNDQGDIQWCVNMRTGFWSRFGRLPGGMVRIPGGTAAGENPLAPGEQHHPNYYPPEYHLVVPTFYMDRQAVSLALWSEVRDWAAGQGYEFGGAGSGKAPDHPVRGVTWHDSVKWCNARSEREGRQPVYYTDNALTQVYRGGAEDEPHVHPSANGYRLPTDAQREYAARGGLAGRRFPWDGSDDIGHARANYFSEEVGAAYDTSPTHGLHPEFDAGDEPHTSPAGFFPPNGFGLFDMAGNVAEWCDDWYPNHWGQYRVARGGSWDRVAEYCRAGDRDGAPPSLADPGIGFRTVINPHPAAPIPGGVTLVTSLGEIRIALFSGQAPVSVRNFVDYLDSGFYKDTLFHRVIGDFMIQGGGFDLSLRQKTTRLPIKNEAGNGLLNRRGTVAMARTQAPHSATSQFFINVVDNPFLDFTEPTTGGYGYCVFGEVVAGMEVVDAIGGVETGPAGGMTDVPLVPVVILDVVRWAGDPGDAD